MVTRWAWAEIDLDAISRNVADLAATVAPSDVWAVVKADGYGHGAVEIARAALAGGATGLCVALVQEGAELRAAGLTAPILVLSEQPESQIPALIEHRLTPTVYTAHHVAALAAAAQAGDPVGVHLKIDTGMQRVGVHPDDACALVRSIDERADRVRLTGVFTHLATADDPGDPAAREQLDRFDAVLDRLDLPGSVDVHAANSAGALAWPDARRSFVRVGIAMYGISPGPGVDHLATGLRPAMSVRARVSYVKRVAAGSRISYGLRHTFERDTTVATVPIGYADGVPRRLWATGGEVLIGGRRRPIVGVVTMDQLMVDCGDDAIGEPGHDDPRTVAVGDEVVLIGVQDGPGGSERIRAEDWAEQLDTIGYEIVCGIGPRVPRIPHAGAAAAPSLDPGMADR